MVNVSGIYSDLDAKKFCMSTLLHHRKSQNGYGEKQDDLYTEIDYLLLIFEIYFQFECCGITADSYRDWDANEYFHCADDNPSAERCGVPPSCCINRKNMVGLICRVCSNVKEEVVTIHILPALTDMVVTWTKASYTCHIQPWESH